MWITLPTGPQGIDIDDETVCRGDVEGIGWDGDLEQLVMLGTLSTAAVGYVILTHRTDISRIFVWPVAYAAIAGGAVAAVISWRYRVAALTSPGD